MSKKRFERGKISLIFILGMFLGGGIVFWKAGSYSREINARIANIGDRYLRMEQIGQLLSGEYYDHDEFLSGQTRMIQQATKAFVDGLGDPFTSYLDVEEFSGLQTELEGEGHIEGIGAVVGKKDYYIQIEEILKDSPAFKSGLMPLDRIVVIGTGETKDLTTSEAVQQIRGPKGTSVQLLIERINKEGTKSYLEKEVIRDVIEVPSVTSQILEQDGDKIGYLEVSVFGDKTNQLFARAISELLEHKVKGIILDLRGNGGGLLEAAVELAGHFLPKGTTVVQTEYSVFEPISYSSKGFGELEKMPIVVLIDQLSASSSEIVALALREQLQAILIGTQSFGKSSIQTLHDFDDGTSLKYTIGKWFGPQGTSIDKEGIKPDIEIPFDFTGYIENGIDNQLEKAKEILQEKL